LAAIKDSMFEFKSCYSIGQKQIGSFVETNIKPRKAAFARVKVIPNPRAGLLAQVREVIRVKRREFSELSERVEIEYSSATGPVQRLSRRVAKDSEIATLIKHAMQQIDNE
jgi:hypothetical protein